MELEIYVNLINAKSNAVVIMIANKIIKCVPNLNALITNAIRIMLANRIKFVRTIFALRTNALTMKMNALATNAFLMMLAKVINSVRIINALTGRID